MCNYVTTETDVKLTLFSKWTRLGIQPLEAASLQLKGSKLTMSKCYCITKLAAGPAGPSTVEPRLYVFHETAGKKT